MACGLVPFMDWHTVCCKPIGRKRAFKNFQILDSDDQLRLIKRVCRELGLDEAKWPPKQAQWFINGQKDEGLRAAHIEPPLGDIYTQTLLRVYAAYEEACQRGGLVDFAELLLRAHELWLKSRRSLIIKNVLTFCWSMSFKIPIPFSTHGCGFSQVRLSQSLLLAMTISRLWVARCKDREYSALYC